MSETRLFILGAGVLFPTHLTIETIEALGECQAVFSNLPDDALSLLPVELNKKCTSLWPFYKDGQKRVENYERVIGKIIEETHRLDSVGWLTRGNPVIFDSVTTGLINQAKEREWSVSVLPAISSVDTILVDLKYEPAGGLLMLEATVLVRRSIALNPDVATLLYQPSAFNTDHAHLTWKTLDVNLQPLRDYLQAFFSPEHPCAFVSSPEWISQKGRITWLQVKELAHVSIDIVAGASLFIPPRGFVRKGN